MNQIKGWKTDAFPKSDTHREKLGGDPLSRLYELLLSVSKPGLFVNKQDTSGAL